eukprot:9499600-Pyramimonas_sp.AAC.2
MHYYLHPAHTYIDKDGVNRQANSISKPTPSHDCRCKPVGELRRFGVASPSVGARRLMITIRCASNDKARREKRTPGLWRIEPRAGRRHSTPPPQLRWTKTRQGFDKGIAPPQCTSQALHTQSHHAWISVKGTGSLISSTPLLAVTRRPRSNTTCRRQRNGNELGAQ